MDHPEARASSRVWLLVLLALCEIPKWAQIEVTHAVDAAAIRATHSVWPYYAATLLQIVSTAVAGFIADRFGPQRVMTWGLIAWALCLASITYLSDAATALLPLGGATAAVALLYGAGVVCAKQAFETEWRARAIAFLDVTTVIWMVGTPLLGHSFVPSNVIGPACGVLAICGGVIAAIWWLATRRPLAPLAQLIASHDPAPNGSPLEETLTLFRHRQTWILVLLMSTYALSFVTLYHVVPLYLRAMQRMDWTDRATTIAPSLVVYVVTSVIVFWWSDRDVERTRNPAASRGLFIAAGSGVAAAIFLLPFASGSGEVALLCLVAFGQAMLGLIVPLFLDVMPRASIGRFSCLAAAITLVATLAIFLIASTVSALTRSYAVYFYLSAAFLVVGALASWRLLPSVEPMEEGPSRAARIVEIFS